jgi:hypothetical protein
LVRGHGLFISGNFNLVAENNEKADSEETLESDEDGYPLLPENVVELRLSRRKAVLRRFMAAARRLYCSHVTLNDVT